MAAADPDPDPAFPCSISLHLPFPTARLASTALRAIHVDPELSPLVHRHLTLLAPSSSSSPEQPSPSQLLTASASDDASSSSDSTSDDPALLHVHYRATTNRMLRVAVNSFMDNLAFVLDVMNHLDSQLSPSSHMK